MMFFLHNGPSMRSPALDIDESKRSARSQTVKAEGQVRAWDDEDIALFKPERWLVSNGNDVAFDSQAGPNIPSGLGLWACFGRRLAYVKFRVLLTMLGWNFEMLPCPEEVSGYGGLGAVAHQPAKCYVQLWGVG